MLLACRNGCLNLAPLSEGNRTQQTRFSSKGKGFNDFCNAYELVVRNKDAADGVKEIKISRGSAHKRMRVIEECAAMTGHTHKHCNKMREIELQRAQEELAHARALRHIEFQEGQIVAVNKDAGVQESHRQCLCYTHHYHYGSRAFARGLC